jgi:hypothetical protein
MDIYTFDFDEWASLAKSAPDIFEQRRRKHVERFVSEGQNTRRLRGLQCRIDMERIRSRTAMKACLRISSLMWDSLLDCQEALNTFVYRDPQSENSSTPKPMAQIIHLQTKK